MSELNQSTPQMKRGTFTIFYLTTWKGNPKGNCGGCPEFHPGKTIRLRETKSLLEFRTFYDGNCGRLAATIQNRGKLCGREINPVRPMGVTTKIERIGLQMKGATGTVRCTFSRVTK